MRTIGVVTTTRADYGLYLPLLRAIEADPELRLYLIVTGMHLAPEFGLTVQNIEADGFVINNRLEMLLSSDTPQGVAKSVGLGTIGFAQLFAEFQPDMLIVLGDRFEMFVAALSALPYKIPVAHIHGGELTQGAIDDALRHAMTKLSHLHFVSTQEYAHRVMQLGEEPWRVVVSGAPGLDNLQSVSLLEAHQLEARFGITLEPPPLLVTFHPVALEYEQTEWQVGELLAALKTCALPIVFTLPNADTSGRLVGQMIRRFVETTPQAYMVDNLGTPGYLSMMTYAAAMVGNSSSGLVEAPSFKLPVVNIGTRQQGRIRAANVIDVGYAQQEIVSGIRTATDPSFRASLADLVNPYGSGQAAAAIVARLKDVALDEQLIVKRFYDMPVVNRAG